MKKLDKFTIKSYIGPFVLTFFIALFVLLMQFLWKYIDDFVGKGFEWYVIAKLMFYASATFVPLALPLAVLLSSLMTFGNLGEYYELVAIKSSGISLQKLMNPLVVFIIGVSIGAFYFSNYVLPKANLEFLSLLRDVQQKKPAVSIVEGVFNSEIGNYVIKVGKKKPDGVNIENIVIYDHSKYNGNTNVTLARSGQMKMTDDKKYLMLSLENGVSYDENVASKSSKEPLQTIKFSKEVQFIDLSAFEFKKSNKALMRNGYQMLNVYQLVVFEDSLAREQDSVRNDFINNSIANITSFKKYYLRDTTLKNQHYESELVGANEINTYNINSKIDTSKTLNSNFLSNFDSINKIRILGRALSLARNASYLSSTTLMKLDDEEKNIINFKVEWHRKYTLSIACILFFFIGAPLGSIIRKGGLGMPLVISIIMFVLYYVLTIIGEKSVKSGILEPWIGIWLSSFFYFPLGVFLTWKATTDAPLLDSEVWYRLLSKYNIFKNKIKNDKSK